VLHKQKRNEGNLFELLKSFYLLKLSELARVVNNYKNQGQLLLIKNVNRYCKFPVLQMTYLITAIKKYKNENCVTLN
jgi:glutathione peroxidase-family protein